ncbi:DNA-binding CsgD family transcriptional regulator/sugar-specific transcriptional regulator TrmB [Kitasatospora sp. MAP12-15]|uniref:helix-turn-helix transcriptional regulator n=1 Tax=unclassified Kitasatospora TaxID=2633591 RepID=UPI0024752BB3|nr:LuxR family transcriptional regulator [Kitasatospora sp. MAP12-44]MDH6108947.1 DNA-binding CsgD family transcriptional regulator/sugar-specific transcriptional regulator TrmB [Kitasatospora sp. MAP12-44]
MLEALGLTTTAAAVYRAMLDHPGHGVGQLADLTGLTPGQVHDCLDELTHLMLVRTSSEHPGQLRAVSPEVGLADVLARQEADLAARQAQLAFSRAAVTRLVAERADSRSGYGERLLGMDAIQNRLDILMRNAATECVGVHPGAAQRPEDLAAGREGNAAAIARGVTVKSLYQDATRNDPHTTAYAQWLLSLGSEVRTAPVLPQRLVIVDRAQALVPIDPADTRKGALHVTEPGIVGALAGLFEQAWATAVPLGATRAEDPNTGLTDTERALLRLLGTGLTDEAAGQRLGISARTVSRHMASVMERLGATSRFEAGIKAAQLGWL